MVFLEDNFIAHGTHGIHGKNYLLFRIRFLAAQESLYR